MGADRITPARADPDEVARTLRGLGNVARWTDLRAAHRRRDIDRAVAAGALERIARGRFAVPGTTDALAAASAHTGALSHLSAAIAHRWPVKEAPAQTWIVVPPGRRVRAPVGPGIRLAHRVLTAAERLRYVTSPLHTVLDCARLLPFDEALAVADSALRSGMIRRTHLHHGASTSRGAGSDRIRRVAGFADGRAANPFESVLRAIALMEGAFTFVPQQEIRHGSPWDGPNIVGRVDLADRGAHLILEAEGFEWHGTRGALVRDCRRYTTLAAVGWGVLRFTWEDVMLHPDYVAWAIRAALQTAQGCAVTSKPPLWFYARRASHGDVG